MARTVKEAKLESCAARGRLSAGGEYFRTLIPGQLHLGYLKRRRDAPGIWFARMNVGAAPGKNPYRKARIGLADDYQDADGVDVFSFAEAQTAAYAKAQAPKDEARRPLTVAEALTDYVDFLKVERKTGRDAEGRINAHIIPAFGRMKIADLTTTEIERWKAELAASPPRARTRPGTDQQFRTVRDDEDGRRARQASANRTLTVLKAALNRAFAHGRVADDLAWRRVKPFRSVDSARPGSLSVDEARRLVSAADETSGFKALVQAALYTGCRYGELCALRVGDVIGTKIAIRRSKAGKARDVRLTAEGAAYFAKLADGRSPAETLLRRGDGRPWGPSHQNRPMAAACAAAEIEPIGIHALRHTWASLAVMNGVPLMVVAHNLGHADTRMVEKHYGHLTETYIDQAIRDAAPRFGFGEQANVVPLQRRGVF